MIHRYLKIIWFLFTGILLAIILKGIYSAESPVPLDMPETPQEEGSSSYTEKTALIPAGEFLMGNEMGNPDERPLRRVYLDAFFIDAFEVTNAQYAEFVEFLRRDATAKKVRKQEISQDEALQLELLETRHFREPRMVVYLGKVSPKALPIFRRSHHPVVGVLWEDAAAYCQWKGKRLPTEAEWEKAARGTDGGVWPWGNMVGKGLANTKGVDDDYQYTSPVGRFEEGQSPYGVSDMAGNVWEWVADWYQPAYYQVSLVRNPRGPETGREKVLRGGSWNDAPSQARTSFRFRMFPDYRDITVGFRCAKDLR